MSKPIEFGEFYKLIKSKKKKGNKDNKDLDVLLGEYEEGKKAESDFDQLGQIFCFIGIKELYNYTGIEDISEISLLDKNIWDYLTIRMKRNLSEYIKIRMIEHVESTDLLAEIANKWKSEEDVLKKNLEGLAEYVTEGIVEIII